MPLTNQGFRDVFSNAPAAMRIEDFSRVKDELEALASRGVTDLASHLAQNHADLVTVASAVEVLAVNRATLELFRAESEQQLLAAWQQPPTDQWLEGFGRNLVALAGGARQIECETINHAVDGAPLAVSVSWSLAGKDDSDWSRVIVAVRDSSRRMRAEAEATVQRRDLEQLADSLPEVIYEVDTRGQLTFINKAAVELFGYSRAEIAAGMSVSQFISPPQRARGRAAIGRILAGEDLGLSEYVGVRKDGTTLPFVVHSRAVLDPRGAPVGVRGVIIDITQRREREAERERLITELEEALRNVRTLGGLLPICASCKKIRDDEGFWHQVESYMSEHTEAEFSHSLCPSCTETLYRESKKRSAR